MVLLSTHVVDSCRNNRFLLHLVFNIFAIFVSMWLQWISYTYCMDTSLGVTLLVVYCYNGGTLKLYSRHTSIQQHKHILI